MKVASMVSYDFTVKVTSMVSYGFTSNFGRGRILVIVDDGIRGFHPLFIIENHAVLGLGFSD